jgi:hypothetical protein
MLDFVGHILVMTESPPEPDDYALSFAPVPLARARHDGWSEARQRDFILNLRETGIVALAARTVGCTAQTAYRLRQRAGAEAFAAAWDRALGEARDRACDLALSRAIHGVTLPRYYRGNFVGTMHRFETRLALAALNAADNEARRARLRGKGDK